MKTAKIIEEMAKILEEAIRNDMRRGLILIGRDPYGRDIYFYPDAMPAPDVVIFGPIGMGKTWTAATLLLRLKQAGYSPYVTIIDPHGEYVNLRDVLGAKVIEVGEKDYIDIFSNNNDEMNKLAIELTRSKLNVMDLNQIKNYYAPLLVGDALPISAIRDAIVAFSGRTRSSSDFMYIYGTLLVYQLYRHALEVAKRSGDKWIIVIDDSYLFDKEILKKLVSERKSDVGIWLITREPSLLSWEVITLPLLKIILGGENVPEMLRDVLELDYYEVKWLRSAKTPLELGGRAQALIIHGPSNIRYTGYVELAQEVKPGRPRCRLSG